MVKSRCIWCKNT